MMVNKQSYYAPDLDVSEHSLSVCSNEGTVVAKAKEEDGTDLEEELAKRDTKRVNLSKLLVYMVILAAAAVVGVCTYYFMEKEEEIWIQDEFEEFAEEIIETGQNNYHKTDVALGGLCDAMTSFAQDTNTSLPFLTLPNFGIRAAKVMELAGTELVAFVPFVSKAKLEDWESFATKQQGWILQDFKNMGVENVDPGPIPSNVYAFNNQDEDTWFSFPIWQLAPAPTNASASPLLLDLHSVNWVRATIEKVLETRQMELSIVQDLDFLLNYNKILDGEGSSDDEGNKDSDSEDDHGDAGHEPDEGRRNLEDSEDSSSEDGMEAASMDDNTPRSLVVEPVFHSFQRDSPIVGVVISVLPWIPQFSDLVEGDEAKGMIIDLENTCDSAVYSFAIREDGTKYIGTEVQHSEKYKQNVEKGSYVWTGEQEESSDDRRRFLQQDSDSADDEEGNSSGDANGCMFSTSIYMSEAFEDTWQRQESVIYTVVVIGIFLFTGLAFLVFDLFVTIRQRKVMTAAKTSNDIVVSMFPKNVRDQLMAQTKSSTGTNNKQRFVDFLQDGNKGKEFSSKPIADYFVNTTIMFADMVGFTSWSSAREPSAVFTLLETVYSSFDRIAERRGVFKVETVGDCYVAVCGLPHPNKKHALVMARFARDVSRRMNELARKLEKDLGPGTGNLCMRIGLHSGPVTAGVLRGKNARFQLFGDAVNTTSRIESTGLPNRIHCSSEFAELITKAGRDEWLEPRRDTVEAKGKGKLKTFFLKPSAGDRSLGTATTDSASFGDNTTITRTLRLVDWSTEMLSRLLQRLVITRGQNKATPKQQAEVRSLEQEYLQPDTLFLSGIREDIALPSGSLEAVAEEDIDSTCLLDEQVMAELRHFVLCIAERYHENSFHNWEHACSVAHSASLFLARLSSDTEDESEAHVVRLHLDDPLTQFSFFLSALWHDVDHEGVGNGQLKKENAPVAVLYNQSIAEQNSLGISWDLLLDDRFSHLRKAIYTTPNELRRFRQLTVKCVLATDIMDKQLTAERSARWARVFGDNVDHLDPQSIAKSRTTILIEHLIQASDVAHTMQHWHIYRKWNEALFMEMHKAFVDGRAAKDPSQFWYQGELGFFDHYVIPLASKLFTCGVLKVSNDELVSYANQNRTEWEIKGKEIVAEMKEKAMQMHSSFPPTEIHTSDSDSEVRTEEPPFSKSIESHATREQQLPETAPAREAPFEYQERSSSPTICYV